MVDLGANVIGATCRIKSGRDRLRFSRYQSEHIHFVLGAYIYFSVGDDRHHKFHRRSECVASTRKIGAVQQIGDIVCGVGAQNSRATGIVGV